MSRAFLLAGAAWAALGVSAAAQDWRELYQRGYDAAPQGSLFDLDHGGDERDRDGVILAPNVVPISIEAGRAHVRVRFGDEQALATMIIDTGASVMSVSETLARALVDRGLAVAAGRADIAQADGSVGSKARIIIHRVLVGGRVVNGVEAIINPDGVEMLLPFHVLAAGGPFTIDARAGLLIFGGGEGAMK